MRGAFPPDIKIIFHMAERVVGAANVLVGVSLDRRRG